MSWVFLCQTEQVAEGSSLLCETAGKKIALFHTTEGFFALDDHCPHRSGPLSQGMMEANSVACPWHQWVFDVRTGVCRNIPGQKVATYPVRVREAAVEVDLADL